MQEFLCLLPREVQHKPIYQIVTRINKIAQNQDEARQNCNGSFQLSMVLVNDN